MLLSGYGLISIKQWVQTRFQQNKINTIQNTKKNKLSLHIWQAKVHLWIYVINLKIHSTAQLRQWIKKYNGHEELKASGTAEKFLVSYQQARNYTVKYEKDGLNALQDNRGKRKPDDVLTEIEKLRAELKLEKAKRQKAEMEASF